VIDWYNYIIQHNPTPIGRTTGKGNAYETPMRDKTHGRIYRIAYQAAKPTPQLPLSPSEGERVGERGPLLYPSAGTQSASLLLQALKNDNLMWRMTAQRLLVEHGKTDIVPALCKLVQDQAT